MNLPATPSLFEKPTEVVRGLKSQYVVDGALQVKWLKAEMWLLLKVHKCLVGRVEGEGGRVPCPDHELDGGVGVRIRTRVPEVVGSRLPRRSELRCNPHLCGSGHELEGAVVRREVKKKVERMSSIRRQPTEGAT